MSVILASKSDVDKRRSHTHCTLIPAPLCIKDFVTKLNGQNEATCIMMKSNVKKSVSGL